MPDEMVKIESVFPVWVGRNGEGEVFVRDLLDNVYLIGKLSDADYKEIFERRWGFFEIIKKYHVEKV